MNLAVLSFFSAVFATVLFLLLPIHLQSNDEFRIGRIPKFNFHDGSFSAVLQPRAVEECFQDWSYTEIEFSRFAPFWMTSGDTSIRTILLTGDDSSEAIPHKRSKLLES